MNSFVTFLLTSYQSKSNQIFYNSLIMASPEIRVGNENKLIPHDIKVGIACTFILGKGIVEGAKPPAQYVASNLDLKLSRAYERKMRYICERRDRIRQRGGTK